MFFFVFSVCNVDAQIADINESDATFHTLIKKMKMISTAISPPTGAYKHYSSVVPQIIDGDEDLLASLVRDHMDGVRPLNNLRSRYVSYNLVI